MQIPPPPRQPGGGLSLSLLSPFFFLSLSSFPSRTSFNRRCNSYHRERANAILSSNTLLSYSSLPLPHHGYSRATRQREDRSWFCKRFLFFFFFFLFPFHFFAILRRSNASNTVVHGRYFSEIFIFRADSRVKFKLLFRWFTVGTKCQLYSKFIFGRLIPAK